MGFGYDPLGRLKSLTYPDSEQVTYNYDARGRLQNMRRYVNSFAYDAAGRLTAVTYADQTIAVFSYDPKRPWLKSTTVTGERHSTLSSSLPIFSKQPDS